MKRLLIILLLVFPISGYAAETDYYTEATATTQVRSILGESTASFWTDAEIAAWLSEAAQDLSARTLCVQKTADVTLATGTVEYSTEDYTIKILGAYYVSPDIEGVAQGYIGLKRILLNQIADLPHTTPGPPKYFYRYSEDGTGKIGIMPLPTATENGQIVKVIYAAQTNDIAEIPQLLQSATLWYCAAMAYKKEHRYAESDKFYQMYIQKLQALRSDIYDVPPEQK
jgi:hypothetical protein